MYGLFQNCDETYRKILERLEEFATNTETLVTPIKTELGTILLDEDSAVIRTTLETGKDNMKDIFMAKNDTITGYKGRYFSFYKKTDEANGPEFVDNHESTMVLDYVTQGPLNEIVMLCYLVFDEIRVQAFNRFRTSKLEALRTETYALQNLEDFQIINDDGMYTCKHSLTTGEWLEWMDANGYTLKKEFPIYFHGYYKTNENGRAPATDVNRAFAYLGGISCVLRLFPDLKQKVEEQLTFIQNEDDKTLLQTLLKGVIQQDFPYSIKLRTTQATKDLYPVSVMKKHFTRAGLPGLRDKTKEYMRGEQLPKSPRGRCVYAFAENSTDDDKLLRDIICYQLWKWQEDQLDGGPASDIGRHVTDRILPVDESERNDTFVGTRT